MNHLGRQTEVDVNRRAQTHTDWTGSFELFLFIDCNQIFTLAPHSLHHDVDVHISTCLTVKQHVIHLAARSGLCVSMATGPQRQIQTLTTALGHVTHGSFSPSKNSPLTVVSDMHVNDCIDLAFTPNLDA